MVIFWGFLYLLFRFVGSWKKLKQTMANVARMCRLAKHSCNYVGAGGFFLCCISSPTKSWRWNPLSALSTGICFQCVLSNVSSSGVDYRLHGHIGCIFSTVYFLFFKLPVREEAWLHWLHLFDFSPSLVSLIGTLKVLFWRFWSMTNMQPNNNDDDSDG